ncbi:MAG: hypothetical protein V3U03_17390 [Myxococcota bacterium]
MTKTRRELLEELQGRLCRCGGMKKSAHTFCRTCYFNLPPAERSALYHEFGDGYEEAYQTAVETLERLAQRPPSP